MILIDLAVLSPERTIIKVSEDPKNWMLTKGATSVKSVPPARRGGGTEFVMSLFRTPCMNWIHPGPDVNTSKVTVPRDRTLIGYFKCFASYIGTCVSVWFGSASSWLL